MKNYSSKTSGHVCAAVSCALFASAVSLFAAEYPAPVDGTVTLAAGGTIETSGEAVSGGLTLDKGKLTIAGPVTVRVTDAEALLAQDEAVRFTVLSAVDGIELTEGASVSIDPSCGLEGRWDLLVKDGKLVLYPIKATVITFR